MRTIKNAKVGEWILIRDECYNGVIFAIAKVSSICHPSISRNKRRYYSGRCVKYSKLHKIIKIIPKDSYKYNQSYQKRMIKRAIHSQNQAGGFSNSYYKILKKRTDNIDSMILGWEL